jgi:hypothetical protein
MTLNLEGDINMRLSIALAVVAFTAGAPAFGQAPKGPPPVLKIVAATDAAKGHIEFRETHFKTEFRAEFRKVVVNGVEVDQAVQIPVTVPFQVQVVIDAGKSRIITPDGKEVPKDDLWKRVKAKSVVVVSGDNAAPAPAYLRALSAETIVIIPLPLKDGPKKS